jgi:hypothetical protein
MSFHSPYLMITKILNMWKGQSFQTYQKTVLKHVLQEVLAAACFQENDTVLDFRDGFVIIRDEFKHFVSLIHPFLSSSKSFGVVLYEKGENRLLKTGDFLEIIIF